MPKNVYQKGNKYGRGRPKGSKNKTTVIRERSQIILRLLNEHATVKHPITGKQVTLAQEEIIMLAQIAKAIKGDTIAARFVMQTAYDPLPVKQAEQQSEITTFVIDWNKSDK